MSYEQIDPPISAWVKRHSLNLFTAHHDCDVRSVTVVSSAGQRFQIWIDRPRAGRVAVHLWDYRRRRRDWNVAVSDLAACLESVSSEVAMWMQSASPP